MKHSKRMSAGYLMIDHRHSPGLSDDQIAQSGLPPGAGRGLYEEAFVSCSHCQAVILLRHDRTRPRAHCSGCDRYICDGCEFKRVNLGEGCKTAAQQIDEILERAIKDTRIQEV